MFPGSVFFAPARFMVQGMLTKLVYKFYHYSHHLFPRDSTAVEVYNKIQVLLTLLSNRSLFLVVLFSLALIWVKKIMVSHNLNSIFSCFISKNNVVFT